jgi:hypothetical protein
MLRELDRAQKGQALIMFMAALAGLMACMALLIDGGNAYVQRRVTQKAADAGAMAGAHALALGQGELQAIVAATEYATAHNDADSADVTIDAMDETVTVIAHRSVATFFAGVIGQPQVQVVARASASFAPVGALPDGVSPIAVHWQDYEFGQTYDIFAGGGPGNFGWLGWDGCTDSDCLCDNLVDPVNSQTYTNPYDPDDHVLSTGDWVPGSTGVATASCIKDKLDALIATQTPITLMVWDQAQGEGSSCEYRMVGFAKFILEDHRLPSENRITGRFVRGVTPGAAVTAGSGYGVYRVVATE